MKRLHSFLSGVGSVLVGALWVILCIVAFVVFFAPEIIVCVMVTQ